MSDDLLDTIDHVLSDYATSPDAMRWTPEPAPAIPAIPILRPLVMPTIDPEYIRAMTRAFEAVGKTFQQAVQRMLEWAPRFAELKRQVEAAQAAERQSAMHSAYRQRTRARKRR